jgi:hypothetical protein
LVNIAESAVENNTFESYVDEMLDENERKLVDAYQTSRTKPKTTVADSRTRKADWPRF